MRLRSKGDLSPQRHGGAGPEIRRPELDDECRPQEPGERVREPDEVVPNGGDRSDDQGRSGTGAGNPSGHGECAQQHGSGRRLDREYAGCSIGQRDGDSGDSQRSRPCGVKGRQGDGCKRAAHAVGWRHSGVQLRAVRGFHLRSARVG